jgi:hypothetical protein
LIWAAQALDRGGFGGRGCSTRREWAFASAIVHASTTRLAAEALAPILKASVMRVPLARTTIRIVVLSGPRAYGQAPSLKASRRDRNHVPVVPRRLRCSQAGSGPKRHSASGPRRPPIRRLRGPRISDAPRGTRQTVWRPGGLVGRRPCGYRDVIAQQSAFCCERTGLCHSGHRAVSALFLASQERNRLAAPRDR